MAVVLPGTVVGLLWLEAFGRGHGPRKAVLLAAAYAGGLSVLITEGLSLVDRFTAVWLIILWSGVACLLFGWLVYRDGPAFAGHLDRIIKEVRSGFCRCVFLVSTGGLVGTVFILGLLAAPNTPDVMTYHLPRVMHWVQNASVSVYSTWIPRQLYMPPLAEFFVSHLYLLAGSDRFIHGVQGSSLAGCCIVASFLAERLGAGRFGQGFAAVFVVTLPMALLQGMTAQNDLVLSFWILGLVVFTVELVTRETPKWEDGLGWGICLGLALLTKGTALLFAIPPAAVLGVEWIRRGSRRSLDVAVISVILPLAVLPVGHFLRTARVFGHPMGSESVRGLYANGTVTPRVVASNVLRNLTLQLNTPFHRANDWIERGVRGVHGWMGVSPNDPRSTWPGTTYHVERSLPHQDRASNPFHVLLLLGALVWLLAVRPGPRSPPGVLGMGLIVAFVGFCAAL